MRPPPGFRMDPVKQIIRTHWNKRAAGFDQRASHGLLNETQAQAWRRLILKVSGTAHLDVLDVGCGTGVLSLLLAECGHRVVGIDIAPAMLAIARAKSLAKGLAISFIECDAETPPLSAASVDLIIERHVLWTLPHPEAALVAWRQLLRSDGRLVLIEGHWGSRDQRDEYEHIQDQLPLYGGRPAEELAVFVRKSGFESVLVEPLMDTALWTELPSHPRYILQCH